MKFGKEFVSQMVPEWQEAYMDYTFLKTLLKEVQRYKQTQRPSAAPPGLKRRTSLYRAFSGLTQRRDPTSPSGSPDVEAQAILVNSVSRDGSASYETTFLKASEDGGEYELVYFRRLDDELNKAEKFYKAKVAEVVKEAEMLDKQMAALIAFRIKVENPPEVFDRKAEITRLASDVAVSAATVSASTPLGARKTASMKVSASRRFQMDVIEEDSSHHETDESVEEEIKEAKSSYVAKEKVEMQRPKMNIVPPRMAPMEILGNVKLHNNLETPRSTIMGVLKVPGHTELNFTRENLTRVEEQLQRAFVEFYQKLSLLKSFSFLNILAFSKIMKKYDKITSRSASKPYMKMVDNSYIGSSDEVTKLMGRVEATFIKHFSNSNRAKGMNILRPQARRERHRTTFSVGYFAGCTSALIIALFYIIRTRKIMDDPEATKYMNTMFPLYSLFGFIVLHLIMYAINIFYWRRYRVNYAFIFGFKQGTELGYRQVLLVGFGIAVLALLCVLSNLDMQIDPKTKNFEPLTELLPLFLVVFIFVMLFLPFNILYKANRYFFLTCLLHCIGAPLYKVTLPDFFLGDQLTSQVQAFRSLEFYVCYYGWGDYKLRENNCRSHPVFNTFNFIVAVIPYMFRLMQCIRRLYEEKSVEQGWNGLKYFLTIVAVCLRTAYNIDQGIGWYVLAWIFSATAATYCTWWDFVHDWGVLNRNSKNPWLRDKLLVPHKKVYYIAMVLNVLLRFAWLQTVLNFKTKIHPQTLVTIVASLEIIRRGIWNFFRLENEHLNNVGKYRAFKSVPLPFSYDEDDDKDA